MVGIIENEVSTRDDVRDMLNNILAPISIAEASDFTVSETHRNKRVLASKTTTLTVTLPNNLPAGFQTLISHQGTGFQINFAAASGATLNSYGGFTASFARFGTISAWVKTNVGGSSAVWQLDGALTYLDKPVVSTPSATPGVAVGTINVVYYVWQTSTTVYWVVTDSATQPTVAQIVAGDDHTGADALAVGSGPLASNGQQSGPISNLPFNEIVYFHVIVRNVQGNFSDVATTNAVTVTGGQLVGHWPLNEGSGTTFTDIENAHNGTLTDATAWSGGPGGSYVFGPGDVGVISDHADFNFGLQMTAFMWVNGTVSGGICMSQYNLGTPQAIGWYVQNVDGKFIVLLSADNTTAVQKVYGSATTAFDGTFHSVAFTWNSGVLKLYVDGVLEASPTIFENDTFTQINNVDWPLYVGRASQNEAEFAPYTGIVRNIRLYNEARSDANIAALHALGI